MSKDINIRAKLKGGAQTKRELDEIARITEGVGETTHAAGKKGARGMGEMGESARKTSRGVGTVTTAIAGWLTRLIGIAAAIAEITRAIMANAEAMQEHAQAGLEQQNTLTRLQYLGDWYKEHPEGRKEVAALAVYGRRSFEEVAKGWCDLRSQSGDLSKDQRFDILREAVELGRTDTEAPLGTLIEMFTLYAKKTKQGDSNRIQNVLKQTITEAGGGAVDVANYMTGFMPVGMAAGLSGPEAAGLWAHATTLGTSTSTQTTALRSVVMGLQGAGTAQSQRILRRAGIGKGMGFREQIDALAQAKRSGRLGLPEAQQLVGAEGASLLLDLLNDPAAMQNRIDTVVGADRGDIDITADQIKGLLSEDEMATLEDAINKSTVEIENVKGGDIEAVRFKKYLQDKELEMERAGASGHKIAGELKARKFLGGLGLSSAQIEAGGVVNEIAGNHPQLLAFKAISAGVSKVTDAAGTVINNYHNEQITNHNPIGRDDDGSLRGDPNEVVH